jgi:hypothetical protein
VRGLSSGTDQLWQDAHFERRWGTHLERVPCLHHFEGEYVAFGHGRQPVEERCEHRARVAELSDGVSEIIGLRLKHEATRLRRARASEYVSE